MISDISDGLSRASGNLRDASIHWKIWNSEQKICIWHIRAHTTTLTTEREQTPPRTALMTWRNSKVILEPPRKDQYFSFFKKFCCWNHIVSTNTYPREVTIMQECVPMRRCRASSSFGPQNSYSLFCFPFRVSNNVSNPGKQSFQGTLNAQLECFIS